MAEAVTTRKCLFCDSPANSREHVIPQWLSKRMNRRDYKFRAGRYSEQTGAFALPETTALTFKTRQVCNDCNNGWMSQLETWFQRHLGFLVEPDWPLLGEDMVYALREEPEPLMRWMIKTAIVFDRALPNRQIGAIPEALHAMAKDRVIGDDFHLLVGYIMEPALGVFLSKGFPVWNGGSLYQNQHHVDGFGFSICLNHLAIRLVRAPDANIGIKAHGRSVPDGAALVPYFVNRKMRYETPVKFSFPNFELFLDAVELYTGSSRNQSLILH